LKMPLEDTEEATAPTDLSRPYEQRHVHSYPSTMSSHSPLRNLSGYDDSSTAGWQGQGGGGGGPKNHHQHHQAHLHHPLPATPDEVQMHFQFGDAVGCSPIPGIPEEDELRARPAPRPGKTVSRLPPKPHPSAAAAFAPKSQGSQLGAPKFPHASGAKDGQEEAARLSFSTTESLASTASTGAKLRRLRPMPDMSAFEMESGSKSGAGNSVDDMSGKVSSPSPKRKPLCPPTPVRTPVWAQPCIADDDNDGAGGAERLSLFQKHHRSNSLIITRVLATCSPQTMEPDYSMSTKEDFTPAATVAAKASSSADSHCMDQEMDLENFDMNETADTVNTSSIPKHPEAPPPIRRSVGEMGSIVSFETDFEVLGVLGKGAFADVYKVRSKFDNRLYAVKRNRRHFRGIRDRELALAEVRSMQRLQQHATSPEEQQKANKSMQYLLFFYRAWQEDGHFFCQTELCCRDTCRELMDSLKLEWGHARNNYPSLIQHLPAPEGTIVGSPLDLGGRLIPNLTVWKICHDISAGLSHIHTRGIVHHDIKPSNIFFVAHHKFGSLCKIGDFGCAGKIGTSDDGQEGDQMYMAPELLSSGVKQASSDVFSLGLTLYEVAAGVGFELPKQGPRWHELRNGSHRPELPSSRDPALASLIQEMMAPKQEQRPGSDSIKRHVRVSLAGSICDEFLRDYIKDIENYDRDIAMRRGARVPDNVADDQTPRTGTGTNGIPCRARVCSPTLVPFPSSVPNIFTPEAQ
jgi:serine/threonine protein kinase